MPSSLGGEHLDPGLVLLLQGREAVEKNRFAPQPCHPNVSHPMKMSACPYSTPELGVSALLGASRPFHASLALQLVIKEKGGVGTGLLLLPVALSSNTDHRRPQRMGSGT